LHTCVFMNSVNNSYYSLEVLCKGLVSVKHGIRTMQVISNIPCYCNSTGQFGKKKSENVSAIALRLLYCINWIPI